MAASIEGILTVDKPSGLTSHDVVSKVRWLTGIRRTGHTGTLDPLATGLLVLCLGRATRLAEYVTELRKEYVATIRLGQETSTYDAEGEILSETAVKATRQELNEALEQFRGEIAQLPPMYSAVKSDGQPLYKYARQGLTVERPKRLVTIFEIRVLVWDPPSVKLCIICSSGTYIRSIAHDLGQLLSCGGHLSALRRTAVGDFYVEDAPPLGELSQDNWQQHVQPADAAIGHLPRLVLSVEEAQQLYHGQPVPFQAGQPEAGLVCAYDSDARFVGIVVAEAGQWQARKILYQPAA